jgi:hypothetical protein
MSKNEFEVLGMKILNSNPGLADTIIPYVHRLFTQGPQTFNHIDAFALLEELELLIPASVMLNNIERNQLVLIYNNLKYQTYRYLYSTIEFV